ncbi:hypothetical protein B0H14DRAFT_3126470 [Mycena olivaceomarginata]|nr:hypothetical protein B0H14DRAFT_3126470 [Mycena olivaceomarginata]
MSQYPRDNRGIWFSQGGQKRNIADRRLNLVEGYSSALLPTGLLGSPNLSGIEGNGRNDERRRWNLVHHILSRISGPTLFEKLFVVTSSPSQDVEGRWSDLVNQGMRVLPLESQPELLLREILGDSSPLSTSFAPDTLPTNVHGVYTQAAVWPREIKTINRLIGQGLLRMGQSNLGSTTKIIQRAKVVSTNKATSTTVTVAFDDTPGLDDTTYLDRRTNAVLMHRYKEKYFQKIFPNIILLVASLSHFTFVIGRSIFTLFLSGLVDRDRTNVLVVITKSLSSWDQFDDFETRKEKDAQWRLEAGRRKGIIIDLQRKIFPPIIAMGNFIENGGGRDMSAPFPTLPDGKLSHQNLFQAISDIMERSTDRCRDLVGIQALEVLTGKEPLRLSSTPEVENLVEQSPEEIADEETTETESLEKRIHKLTGSYLGNTYDIDRGTYGRKSVLSTVELPIQYTAPPVQNKEFEEKATTYHHQAADLFMRRGERLQTHYSSDLAFQSAVSTNSQ